MVFYIINFGVMGPQAHTLSGARGCWGADRRHDIVGSPQLEGCPLAGVHPRARRWSRRGLQPSRRSSICASVRVVPRPVVCGEPDRMVGTRAGPAQAVRGKVRHLNLGMYRTHCDGDVRSADMGAPPS